MEHGELYLSVKFYDRKRNGKRGRMKEVFLLRAPPPVALFPRLDYLKVSFAGQ